ncbi:DUF1488 domain-containing protein [Vibrio sinensis]|uniref:DUF1488 domain-containing protein n=1 Tax=Vibrio sinensis TaxID=2302434 RepID=A0A3A6QJ18_9VIBR|nr:DUF1488 domain-containing protein [Vibrio sinensis]RJX66689.1 DUF1488 domain-containing protein [Vibrio sinensis]
MNQSILFPDIQSWDEELEAVVFPAQQSGALIECLVGQSVLEHLSGRSIMTPQQAVEVFEQYRFDIEELAEEQIEDEQFNASGQIVITR